MRTPWPTLTSNIGWARLSWFPAQGYAVCRRTPEASLGMAWQHQRGLHAYASDRRVDFDAWPGDTVWAAAGVDIYSESDLGGEYMLLESSGLRDWFEPGMPVQVLVANQGTWRSAARARFALLEASLAAAASNSLPARGVIEEVSVPPTSALLAASLEWLAQTNALRTPGLAQALARRGRARARVGAALAAVDGDLLVSLSYARLASLCGLPTSSFQRIFKTALGQSAAALLRQRRVQAACFEALPGPQPLAELACGLGYSHQSHLGDALRRATGHTPAQWRARWKVGS